MPDQELYKGTADQNRRIASCAYWVAAIGAAMMLAAVGTLFGWIAAAGVLGALMFVFGFVSGFHFDGK